MSLELLFRIVECCSPQFFEQQRPRVLHTSSKFRRLTSRLEAEQLTQLAEAMILSPLQAKLELSRTMSVLLGG